MQFVIVLAYITYNILALDVDGMLQERSREILSLSYAKIGNGIKIVTFYKKS
jgi:hypothetical protein